MNSLRPRRDMTTNLLRMLFTPTFGVLCLAGLAAFGQSGKPNLSGRWELDKTKSDFGSGPAPKDIIEQITQEGTNVVVSTTFATPNGDIKKLVKLRTDGVPTVNTMRGRELTSISQWQGDSLVTVTRDGQRTVLSETRTLAKDGKTLTVIVDMGASKQKVVMLKK
ncbi:MAG: hypothetical protein JO340_06825 [Acidobacteriaceae bacterium]|nr:hypothetical protein [Acidobacteriaceae bacterium]